MHKTNCMKKMILGLICLLFIVACNKSTTDSELKNETINNDNSPCIQFVYVIDDFAFHRPKFNCLKGFWFCVTGHWEIRYDCGGLASYNNETKKVTVIAEINDQNKLTIHYPKELLNLYTQEDLATLYADDDYEISEGVTIKKGQYSVEINENDITVIVDLIH